MAPLHGLSSVILRRMVRSRKSCTTMGSLSTHDQSVAPSNAPVVYIPSPSCRIHFFTSSHCYFMYAALMPCVEMQTRSRTNVSRLSGSQVGLLSSKTQNTLTPRVYQTTQFIRSLTSLFIHARISGAIILQWLQTQQRNTFLPHFITTLCAPQ